MMATEHEQDAGLEAFDQAADLGDQPTRLRVLPEPRMFGDAIRAEQEAEGDPGLEAFDQEADREPPADEPAGPKKPRRKVKRRRKGGAQRLRELAGKTAGAGAPAPKPKPGPAAPAALEPIAPELVAKVIGAMTAPLARRYDVPELDADELKGAGEAWGPVLDHYFPAIAARVGMWGAPIAWTVGVIAPRVQLAIETRQEQERRRASGEGFPETPGEPVPAMVATPPHGSGTPGPVVSEAEMARHRGAARAEQVT
jgi:hypothetical protein